MMKIAGDIFIRGLAEGSSGRTKILGEQIIFLPVFQAGGFC